MRSFVKIVFATCLMSAVISAMAAGPKLQQPDSLKAQPAMVSSVDQASRTAVLHVWSAGREPRVYQVSRSCLFAGGLRSMDNLFPSERVLVWTEGWSAGKLPLIVRIERAQN
ncbi:MAG TPA: hypothetical protein VLV87_10095 [Gammaproteobacteria bacterium]|nr:hypothetical protein [Gammaproteobacteria bacterium]